MDTPTNNVYVPPWQRPKIAVIVSIFNGKVVGIGRAKKEIVLNVGGDKDEVQR